MRKHRKLLILLACLAVIGGVVVFATRDNEPHYQGKSLSEWLDAQRLTSVSRIPKDVDDAVRAIGTNALPFLLKWTRYQPRPWEKTARSNISPSASKTLAGHLLLGVSRAEKTQNAFVGFWILGTNAAPAVPELTIRSRDTSHPDIARCAIIALGCIGSPGLPHLNAAFADTNYPYRRDVVINVGFLAIQREGSNACVPLLKAALHDPDPLVSSVAQKALRQFAPELLTNTPAK